MTSEEFIDGFVDQVAHKYPHLSKRQLTEACRHPFVFLREKMKLATFPEIRFKYFGVFRVSVPRAKSKLKDLEKMNEKGQVSEEKYNHYKEALTNFISRHG